MARFSAYVITMEIVGEFLGKDCDKTIWEYFKGHWTHFFPKIPDRSNFARQAANLHVVKRMVQERLAVALDYRFSAYFTPLIQGRSRMQ